MSITRKQIIEFLNSDIVNSESVKSTLSFILRREQLPVRRDIVRYLLIKYGILSILCLSYMGAYLYEKVTQDIRVVSTYSIVALSIYMVMGVLEYSRSVREHRVIDKHELRNYIGLYSRGE